jgi:hypothetical protein
VCGEELLQAATKGALWKRSWGGIDWNPGDVIPYTRQIPGYAIKVPKAYYDGPVCMGTGFVLYLNK